MKHPIWDIDDGDMVYSISDNMAIDSDRNMMMRISDNISMDLDSGDLHFTSSWDFDDDD